MHDTRQPPADDQPEMHALDALSHGVVVTDMAQRVRYLNRAASTLTGRSPDDVVGQPLSVVLACVDPADRRPAPIQPSVDLPPASSRYARLLLRGDGGETLISDTVTLMRNATGRPVGYVVVIQDAGHLQELAYQATHDPLTGLANRREFERRLRLAVQASRHGEVPHALCFLDLDCFKLINDHAGHAAGDAVLGRLARGMRLALRDGDTLGRLGGDEFGILLEHCPLEMAIDLAEGLRELVQRVEFRFARRTMRVRASIGLLAVDGSITDGDDAFRKADIACYVAKTNGRNTVHVYAGESWDHVRANRRRRGRPNAAS